MAKSVFGKIMKATLKVAAFTAAAAAAGAVYGLKKWSDDDDSKDIKITTGGVKGLHISKTDDGKYIVDTKYEWQPEDYEDDAEDEGIVIDISGNRCKCEDCADKAVETVEEKAEEAEEVVAEAVENAGDKVDQVVDAVVEKAGVVKDKVEEFASAAAEKVEEVIEAVKDKFGE